MSNYTKLETLFPPGEKRWQVIENLLKLRKQISEEIPTKDANNHLLLATWNIRDFGKPNRRGYGDRLAESLYYIAEVISAFDLVAVQEVNDLHELHIVMTILGPNWDYIATDVSDTEAGGNGERMTFIFDKRKVEFKNIAGEIVLPPSKLISAVETEVDGKKIVAGKQFRRTPFIVSFKAGWFYFDLCTVHLYYGAASGAKLKERIEEINGIAAYLSDRADDALEENRSLILLGDFNIVSPTHRTMEALTSEGFVVPESLLDFKTNATKTHSYDQIAFKTKPGVIDYIERASDDMKQANAGVFEIFKHVMPLEEWETYIPEMKMSSSGSRKEDPELEKFFKQWRTYQFSDHLPLWVRIDVNDTDIYLKELQDEPTSRDLAPPTFRDFF